MPTLTIKGLPDAVYTALKGQADLHRRSLNSEIIACLERAVRPARIDPSTWLVEAGAFRNRLTGKPLTDREVREARRTGRT